MPIKLPTIETNEEPSRRIPLPEFPEIVLPVPSDFPPIKLPRAKSSSTPLPRFAVTLLLMTMLLWESSMTTPVPPLLQTTLFVTVLPLVWITIPEWPKESIKRPSIMLPPELVVAAVPRTSPSPERPAPLKAMTGVPE